MIVTITYERTLDAVDHPEQTVEHLLMEATEGPSVYGPELAEKIAPHLRHYCTVTIERA